MNGHQVTDILMRKTGLERVNASSGNPGIYTSLVHRIDEVHVRWYGNPDDEANRLEQFRDVLQQHGYTVLEAEENNVDWPSGQSRTFILGRRNRKFLRVAKFHRQPVPKQRQKK